MCSPEAEGPGWAWDSSQIFGTGRRNRGIAHITSVDAHLTEIDGQITLTINRVRAVHEWLLPHP
jgi:hypothetical protein